MANWYGTSRSNYFRVKDTAAFKKEAAEVGLGVWAQEDGSIGIYGLDDGYWPSAYLSDDDSGETEFDIVEFLLLHLVAGEVAILQQSGAEKMRYVTGFSLAIHSDGRTIRIDIDDIYDRIRTEFGVEPRTAQY